VSHRNLLLLLLDTTIHEATHASALCLPWHPSSAACQLCRHCPFGHFNVPDGKRPAEGSEGAAAITAPTLLRGRFSPRLPKRASAGPVSVSVTKSPKPSSSSSSSLSSSSRVDVVLWSGGLGSFRALQAALASPDSSGSGNGKGNRGGNAGLPAAGTSKPREAVGAAPHVVLVTAFDPLTGLLLGAASVADGTSHGSSAVGPRGVGLRGVMDQALALATVDLLALPVKMSTAPGALVPTGALAAAAARGLEFLRSHCGLEPGRVFAGPTPLGTVTGPTTRLRESLTELLAAGGFPPLEPEPLPEAEAEAEEEEEEGNGRAAADPRCEDLSFFMSDGDGGLVVVTDNETSSQVRKASTRRLVTPSSTPSPPHGSTRTAVPIAARRATSVALPEPRRVRVVGCTAEGRDITFVEI